MNLLRVLDAVLDTGSTTEAGKRVGLSQPAVSSALNRLRHALNDPLFVREGQKLVPTPFASALALPLRQTLDRLHEVLSGNSGFDPTQAERVLTIAGTDYFGEMLIPQLVRLIMPGAPGIRLRLRDLTSADYVETLRSGTIDLAIFPNLQTPNWIAKAPLQSSQLVLIARKGHARLGRAGIAPGQTVPLDLFCDLPQIFMSPEGKFAGGLDQKLADIGRERHIVLVVPYFSAVYRTVGQSDLVGMVPRSLARKAEQSEPIDVYELPIRPKVDLFLYWHVKHSGDPAHAWLRDRIMECLPFMRDDPA